MNLSRDTVTPTGKRLLLEVFKQASETSGGLLLSQGDGYATPVLGTVIKAGSESKYKEGDVLMWRRYSIDTLKIDLGEGEQEYSILEDDDVVAVVEPPVEASWLERFINNLVKYFYGNDTR